MQFLLPDNEHVADNKFAFYLLYRMLAVRETNVSFENRNELLSS